VAFRSAPFYLEVPGYNASATVYFGLAQMEGNICLQIIFYRRRGQRGDGRAQLSVRPVPEEKKRKNSLIKK